MEEHIRDEDEGPPLGFRLIVETPVAKLPDPTKPAQWPFKAETLMHGYVPTPGMRATAFVEMIIYPTLRDVTIEYLMRDVSQTAQPGKSTGSRWLLCFGMAMAAHMLRNLTGLKSKDVTLRLHAADEGTGKLVNFYQEALGLRPEEDEEFEGEKTLVSMTGSLKDAFSRCIGALQGPVDCKAFETCRKRPRD